MEKAMDELRKLDPSDSMTDIVNAISDLLKKVKKDMDDPKTPEALELIRKKEVKTREYYMRPLDDDTIYNDLIRIHSDRGEVDMVDFYRRSMDLRQARKWTILGDSSAILGDNKRGAKYLRRALFFGPMDEVIDEVRSALDKAEKRISKAEGNIEKAREKAEADPGNLKYLTEYTKYLMDLDMVNDAEKINEKALKVDDKDFDTLYCMGCVKFFRGDFKEARKVFEKCKEINPKSMNAKRAYNWSVEMIENNPEDN
jgi:tetratricopeptide (TPR) repeat protein